MYRLIIGIRSLTLINDVAQDVKYHIFDCVLTAGKFTATGSARLVEVFSGVWDGKMRSAPCNNPCLCSCVRARVMFLI